MTKWDLFFDEHKGISTDPNLINRMKNNDHMTISTDKEEYWIKFHIHSNKKFE